MTDTVEQAFIAPRYLAGGGDPAWVTVPLNRACGWSRGNDLLMPRVILTSPDWRAQLRLEPTPTPGEPWWSLRHTGDGQQRPWSIVFDAQAPVEIIAAITDTLTDPSAPPSVPNDDLYTPLRTAGWYAPRHHDGFTSTEGMSSPDGLARVDRIRDKDHTASWIVEASVHHLPAFWRGYLDSSTPTHLVSALLHALADTTPLMRAPNRVPHQATTHGATSIRPVSAEDVDLALEDRTTMLAQRRAAPVTQPVPAPPSAKAPRRVR
ncbi:DUF317 domain-containing protein [Streptomyces sp. 840.1]|uniref:DUF317 domain-containing protein n=1 Tax=Streptomyces sp. 840.1 TaxID=2485152 RepID=UPI0016142A6F|nr:DUF317 domain-containing protein [Streptomyces sp. 840.1]